MGKTQIESRRESLSRPGRGPNRNGRLNDQFQGGLPSSYSNGSMKMEHNGGSDIIIVGAGVAGSALAYSLGKDGHSVHLIERDLTMPNRIVGELLQPGGYLKLLELGLGDCVCQIDAQRVVGYVMYKDGRTAKLAYPLNNFDRDVSGKSFHHGRFVQRLREKAASLPNVKLEEGTVISLMKEDENVKGVRYKTKTGQNLIAKSSLTIVCDGCFSNLRRFLCDHKAEVSSHLFGWIMEEDFELPFPNHGHIVFAESSPVLFYPISSTETRCIINIPGQIAPSTSNGELSDYLQTKVAPQIPQELQGAFISTINKGNIRGIPYMATFIAPRRIPGAILLGDALNQRHPFSGGGMTVALSDVVIIRDLLRSSPYNNLNDADKISDHFQSFYTLRRPMATTINTVAALLHSVFSSSPSDEVIEELREVCFNYLSFGGVFSRAPMALLSGLNSSRSTMLSVIFVITFYCLLRSLLPFPSPKRLLLTHKIIKRVTRILVPTMNNKIVGKKSNQ